MRRLLRFTFNALCLLSLLACVATAWLWWQERRSGWATVEFAAMHADLEAQSSPMGLTVRAVGNWPGAAGAWAADPNAGTFPGVSYLRAPQFPQAWVQIGAVFFARGHLRVLLRADGKAERLTGREYRSGRSGTGTSWSAPLPYGEVLTLPCWLAQSLTAVPPCLWLALQGRRLHVVRRRRRLGRCRNCGYDLTGNISGRCSECGSAVDADGRVTA